MAALRGARMLAYLLDMSRILRSVRIALRTLVTISSAFLRLAGMLRVPARSIRERVNVFLLHDFIKNSDYRDTKKQEIQVYAHRFLC